MTKPERPAGAGQDPPRRVQVLANFAKESVRALTAELVPWLRGRVDEVVLSTDIRAFAAERAGPGAPPAEDPQLVVVLGGDGALLGAARAFAERPVPTLGIKLGRVGFLASTTAGHWRETLEGILAGEGVLERRMRLLGRWTVDGREHRAVALNEICLQRGSHDGMLNAALWVGGDWVSGYRADGLIVATPSGSTAYSLSAGGPILEPSVDAFVVTPISPQVLASRPLVVGADEAISIAVRRPSGAATLAIDGQSFHSLEEGQEVCLSRHPVPYPLYAMPELDPYRRLRDRLGWGGGPASGEDDGADGPAGRPCGGGEVP